MAKKLTKSKAKEMLHNPPYGKRLSDKQRKYFGAVASAQEGLSVLDPNSLTASVSKPNGRTKKAIVPPEVKSAKRARIIANALYPEFREEYERAKGQYAKHYPGGVEFVEAKGYEGLKRAFGKVTPEEDLIMMAHYNPNTIYGVDVANPSFGGIPSPQDRTLAGLFSSLQDRGYQGNCYLGICEGEEIAKSLQGAGVNIPIFSTPEGKKWYGSNPTAKGSFEDFFFGIGEKKKVDFSGIQRPNQNASNEEWAQFVENIQNVPATETIDPELGEDYLMNISPRQQELMQRRASGTPVTEVTPLENLNYGGTIKDNRMAKIRTNDMAKGGKLPLYEAGGGLKRSEDYGSKKKPYPSVKSSDFAGGGRSYPIPTKADAVDALRLAGLHGRSDVKAKVYKKYPGLKKKGERGLKLPENIEEYVDTLGGVTGIADTASGLMQGFQMLGQERENRRKAEQFLQLSDVVGQAAGIRPDRPRRKYVRPEDVIIDPNQLYPTYGTGTNYLAKNGKKLPSYQPGGFIPQAGEYLTDITGEGNEGNVGSMLGSLFGGGGGQPSGAGKIGSTLGGVAGSFLGPLGTAAGSFIGGTIGGAIGGGRQREQERKQRQAFSQLQNAAFQQGAQNIQNQYSGFMRYGGKLPDMHIGGDLQMYEGGVETISQNPYLPDGGETVMFRGPSHAEGGMDIRYGKTPVEVEGGEPAVKLEHGGSGQDNLIVYGDMKIPPYGVTELADPKAKGKKFKTYIKELSKIEDKQNRTIDKGVGLVNATEPIDSFDKLKISSGKAMIEGGNMKLKEIADKKRIAASVQNAILDTADEFGLKSDELAKGNIRKAKKGAKIRGYPHGGGVPPNRPPDTDENIYPGGPFAHQVDYDPIREDPFAESVVPSPEKPDWMTAVNAVLPYLRPSNQLPLDPSQLSGEMFALAANQLDPVQAQTYQPLLESVSDISLQDQLNVNQADFNALKRLTANNPAAQATLAAQKYSANQSVLGEQFRLNQAQRMGTFSRNRATLNDATLKNLAILDQQYVRQAGAKSATKATAQAALSSISEKMARNKLENRTLGIYENLYNYRFGPRGQAFNLNPFAQFNISEAGGQLPIYDDEGNITGYRETESVRRDRFGIPTGSTDTRTTTKKTTKRNGGIVKAIKNL